MILTPKNWSSFQHYKDRAPAWIKLHRGLLDDFEFSSLPVASRALAPLLWLLASEFEGGAIDGSLDKIAFRLRMTRGDLADALSPLIEGGFFVASEMLAPCKHEAIPEREIQVKEEIQVKKDGGGVVERAREPEREPAKPKSLISEDAFTLTSEILIEMGKHPEDPISVGGPYIVQHWLNGGMSRDAILCGVKTAMVRKKHDPPNSLKYFENAVLRASAEMNRPLPKVEIREQQTITVNHGTAKARSGGSLLGSIQRELASVEAQIADLALPGDVVLSIPDRSIRRS
jgi:hypothetical protein